MAIQLDKLTINSSVKGEGKKQDVLPPTGSCQTKTVQQDLLRECERLVRRLLREQREY